GAAEPASRTHRSPSCSCSSRRTASCRDSRSSRKPAAWTPSSTAAGRGDSSPSTFSRESVRTDCTEGLLVEHRGDGRGPSFHEQRGLRKRSARTVRANNPLPPRGGGPTVGGHREGGDPRSEFLSDM